MNQGSTPGTHGKSSQSENIFFQRPQQNYPNYHYDIIVTVHDIQKFKYNSTLFRLPGTLFLKRRAAIGTVREMAKSAQHFGPDWSSAIRRIHVKFSPHIHGSVIMSLSDFSPSATMSQMPRQPLDDARCCLFVFVLRHARCSECFHPCFIRFLFAHGAWSNCDALPMCIVLNVWIY